MFSLLQAAYHPPSIYSSSEAHLKVDTSFPPCGSCLTYTRHLCGCVVTTGHSLQRLVFPFVLVSQTLLRGAIRSKIKRKEESQTCSFSYCNLFLSGLSHSPTLLQNLLVYVFDWAHLYTIHCLFSGHDIFTFVFKDFLSLFPSCLLLLLTLESCTPGATFTRKG